MGGISAPAVSPSGKGRIYFDTAAGKFKVSENGGAYVDLVGGGAGFALMPASATTLGTTTNEAVEVRANSERAFRIEPSLISGEGPNLIGGASANSVTSGVVGATVAGGGGMRQPNVVTDDYGTVSGGVGNRAGSDNSIGTDARFATVGGGTGNTASGEGSTVSGGEKNIASGNRATVAGGELNVAGGDHSFAAGRRVRIAANHTGAIVLADSNESDFASAGANEFAVRASGGFRFVTAVDVEGRSVSGVELLSGSGSWSSFSDRNAKSFFSTVDAKEVLKRLMSIPIQTWSYKGQSAEFRHIGPTAQDFRGAFALGENDTHISAVDADGVALASIQGLYELNLEKDSKIDSLTQEVGALKTANADLQRRLDAIEKSLKGLLNK
jgi:hypothetical protein